MLTRDRIFAEVWDLGLRFRAWGLRIVVAGLLVEALQQKTLNPKTPRVGVEGLES